MSTRAAAIAWAFAAALAVLTFSGRTIAADDAVGLSGRWALNRERSEFPQEIGFWLEVPSGGGSSNAPVTRSGGRGRSRSSGAGPAPVGASRPESIDDATRRQQLTEEVRTPTAQISIVDTGSSVAITDDRGRTRTVHPDGRHEVLKLGDTPLGVVCKRDGPRLVVTYEVENNRELRYTYSVAANRTELFVDVQFLEHGAGDTVRRVYRPVEKEDLGPANVDAPKPAAVAAPPSSTATAPAAQAVDQRPDAELKGLRSLSVVVEGVTPASVACGLNEQTLETEVARIFKDAGIQVVRITDNDTYAYVNLNTSNVTSSLCVSRYDVSVYTHTTAVLRYRDRPALVEVLLLHKGAMAGGSPAVHASEVLTGVKESATEFAARIRDANR
jgi:hypothetical protein